MTEEKEKNKEPDKGKEKEYELKLVELNISHTHYITTLDTGSILIMTTFLEKLFSQPEWRFLVGASFIGFVVSIIGCLILQFMFLASGSTRGIEGDKAWYVVAFTSLALAYYGFFTGIGSLTIFALKNFY